MNLATSPISTPPGSATDRVLQSPAMRETIDTVLHLGLQYFGLEVASFTEIRGETLIVHGRRAAEGAPPEPLSAAPGLRLVRCLAIHDVRRSVRTEARRLLQLGVASYIAAPISFEGALVGVIELTGSKPRNAFSQSDEDMAESLARWLETELGQAILQPAREWHRISSLGQRISGTYFARELFHPISSLIGLSEALGEDTLGSLNDEQKRVLSAMHESGRQMLSLVNDILEIARMDAGEVELSIEPCPIERTCESALARASVPANRKNVRLFSAIDPSLSHVRVDRSRFEQLLSTLIENALRMANEGGHVGLDVLGDERSETVTFSVWDDGPSQSEEDVERSFTPFADADAAMSQRAAGLGVGLSLVHRLADLHQGSLTIERPRLGNRFTVTIPHHGTQAPASIRSAWQSLLVLVVDPHGALRAGSEPWLRSRGHRVLSARSHDEAHDQLSMFRPDVVLLDVASSEPAGERLIRRVRGATSERFRDVPIVASSALCLPRDQERYLSAGASEYLRRPLKMRNVMALVERHGPFAKAG